MANEVYLFTPNATPKNVTLKTNAYVPPPPSGGINYWDGLIWNPLATLKYYNGASHVVPVSVKYYNGVTWALI
jgi:hypothetical protein